MKNIDKLFKVIVVIIGLLVILLVSYFGLLGSAEVERKVEPDNSRNATDDILGQGIGFTDESNLGHVIGQATASAPRAVSTVSPQLPNQNGAGQNTVTGATPEELLRNEMELERLRLIMEADIAAEMSTRTQRVQANSAPIQQSVIKLANTAQASTVNPAPNDASTLNGVPSSSVLPGVDRLVNQPSSQPQQTTASNGASAAQNLLGRSSHQRTPARSSYELQKGTVIPGTLVTEINSDIPGNVVGVVRLDVYDSVTGQHLLVPNGSRLFGEYDPDVAYAQKRINVAWTHLIFPNGDTLILEEQRATDIAGRSGFSDKRKGNFLKNLGGNLLFSILNAGETAVQAKITRAITGEDQSSDSPIADSISSLGSQVSGGTTTAASTFNDAQSQLKPTLIIRSGYRFNILVSKDLLLEPY